MMTEVHDKMDETTDHVEAMQVGRREIAPLAHDRPRYSYYVESASVGFSDLLF